MVKAIQALQREDFLALKAHIKEMPIKAPFKTKAIMVEVLSKSLVIAYRYYFNELTSRDLSFISHNVTVISLRQKAIDLSVQCRLLGTEKNLKKLSQLVIMDKLAFLFKDKNEKNSIFSVSGYTFDCLWLCSR